MNKIALVFLILNSVFFPTLPSFSGEEEQKNAAIMILLACTYSQMGQIPRSKIVKTKTNSCVWREMSSNDATQFAQH